MHAVLAYRSTNREAKLVLSQHRSPLGSLLRKIIVGVKNIVAQILEERSMEIVSSNFRDDADICPCAWSESCIIQAGLHLEFLQRVWIGEGNSSAYISGAYSVAHTDTVELPIIVVRPRAVSEDSVRRLSDLRQSRCSIAKLPSVTDTGCNSWR